jgi:hypothetical protein
VRSQGGPQSSSSGPRRLTLWERLLEACSRFWRPNPVTRRPSSGSDGHRTEPEQQQTPGHPPNRTIPEDASNSDVVELLRNLPLQEGTREGAVAVELRDWFTWFSERIPLLQGLSEAETIDLLLRWHRALDYYAWASPEEELDLAALVTLFPPQTARALLQRLEANQAKIRELLAVQGIERIQIPAGSSLLAGQVEWSDLPPVETCRPDLDGRVGRIEPGEGGYRTTSRILVPSRARRYLYNRDAES